ncbi:MAG: DMT family transporter [Rhizobiales bacterium]|nr:DMT family transporter [Hyphomicrobiales bacterium]
MPFRLSDQRTGLFVPVGLVLAANVLLPFQDALTKQIIETVPVWEVLFVRSAWVFAATLVLGRRRLAVRLIRSPLKRFMTVRGLLMLAAWIAFYLAVRHLPLAQAITLYFVSPILVSLAAGPFLGERTPALQWVAIGLGLTGVALAGRLADFAISGAVALALLAACLWAASLLMLRSMSQEESTLVQVSFVNGLFAVATAVPLFVYGSSASTGQILAMMGIGCVGGLGQFCLYEAAGRLPVSALSTLEYTSILSAFALGYLMFAEIPTLQIWLGAALILVSGILVVGVEHGRLQQAAPLARDLPVPYFSAAPSKEYDMGDSTHDLVVGYIARTRFPFPGQTTWAPDYRTLTNVPERRRAISTPAGDHYPDIVIVDGTGRVRELGEVEMTVDEASVPYWKAGSEAADDDTPTKVRHFFVYVPAGQEAAAQALLERNDISYAGVRSFTVNADGGIRIVPFVTKDPYDDKITEPSTGA